jgi:hypothetical protein
MGLTRGALVNDRAPGSSPRFFVAALLYVNNSARAADPQVGRRAFQPYFSSTN